MVYVAINPWQLCYYYYVSHLIGYKLCAIVYMHSNNNSNLATIVLNRKKVDMASVDFTSDEPFACQFDPSLSS